MKNLHLLPTDKPSRLACFEYITNVQGIDKRALKFKFWNDFISSKDLKDGGYFPQNIYITSDEEIKKGDYGLDFALGIRGVGRDYYVFKQDGTNVGKLNAICDGSKKIILTTDQDLISDGVQAIDDEFLEWFVKNPSCESVEVVHHEVSLVINDTIYKIIIPQEESKQETLEEVCDKVLNYLYPNCKKEMSNLQYTNAIMSLKYIAEWQAERMYSQYEVNEIIAETWLSVEDNEGDETFSQARERILEEFKKTKDGI